MANMLFKTYFHKSFDIFVIAFHVLSEPSKMLLGLSSVFERMGGMLLAMNPFYENNRYSLTNQAYLDISMIKNYF